MTDNRVDKKSKAKRVREAKDGKRDFIEDIMGSEPISGTDEVRDRTAKILAIDRAERVKKDRSALEYFRQRRKAAIRSQLLSKEQVVLINKQIQYVLWYCCEPAAYEYLNLIRQRDNELCHKICYALFPPEEMKRLDGMVDRIYHHGPPKKKITLTTIIKYERAFKGIKSKIEVERDGERTEIFKARKIA